MQRIAIGLPLLAPCAFSQANSRDPLLGWMDRIAPEHLQRREAAIAEIRDAVGAEQCKKVVREKMLSLLGGLPEYSSPLNARVTARSEATGTRSRR
jgi:hypothetical protein